MEKNKIRIFPYSKSLDKKLKLLNKNKDLENLIQDINIINKNIIRYNQIENLLKSDIKYDNEDDEIINLQKYLNKIELKQSNNTNNIIAPEKQKVFSESKQLCNKVYSGPKNTNTINTERIANHQLCIKDIKPYKNSINEAMNSIFKRKEIRIRKYFPLYNSKTNDKNKMNNLYINSNFEKKLYTEINDNSEKNINYGTNLLTDRVIEDYKSKKYQNNYYLPRTIETDRKINISYGNYASNKVKFKHPQFYVLNTNNTPVKKKLPPIKGGKLNMVDLLRKNNSQFNMLNKNRNKFDKFYLAMRMGEISKFKIN